MALFDFFRRKVEPTSLAKPDGTPNDKHAELRVAVYWQVFYEVMADVDGFTPEEFDAMAEFIVSGDGSYMNMGHYYKPVFNKFFAGRHWAWEEYEYWERAYAQMGERPLRFPVGLVVPKDRSVVLTADKVLGELKVSELKEFLEAEALVIPPKAKKKDLITLAQSLPNLNQTKIWKLKEAEVVSQIGYPLYSLLMRYIAFKANSTYERARAANVGVTKFQHLYVEVHDEYFVDLALARNPRALPPYFPGDVTLLRPVIPDFD